MGTCICRICKSACLSLHLSLCFFLWLPAADRAMFGRVSLSQIDDTEGRETRNSAYDFLCAFAQVCTRMHALMHTRVCFSWERGFQLIILPKAEYLTFLCMCIHTYIRTYIYTCTHAHAHMHAYIRACMHACILACVCVCTCMRAYFLGTNACTSRRTQAEQPCKTSHTCTLTPARTPLYANRMSQYPTCGRGP